MRPLAIVCHLLPGPAAEGCVVGHVEVVATGDTFTVADVDELLSLITRLANTADVD